MTISEKENILRFYNHQEPEHLPDLEYLHTVFMARGFIERPLTDEGMTRDWFGVPYDTGSTDGPAMPDPSVHVLEDVCDWREVVQFPDLDSMDWEAAARKDGADKVDRRNKAFSVLIQCGMYERMHSLMGIEGALVSFLEEPEEAKALLDAITDYKVKLIGYIIDYYKPDIIRHHDDYGTQRDMQMAPDLWREMIKPNIKRLVDLCHDRGVIYEQHSCGIVEPIIPDFVEIGVDSWQGMHINDVPALQRQTQGRLLYHMSLNMQNYTAMELAGKLTEEGLRQDIRDTVIPCAEDGTYFPVITVNNGAWVYDDVVCDELAKLQKEVVIKYPWK